MHTLGEVIGCNLYLTVGEDLPWWHIQGRICTHYSLPHATAHSSRKLENTERMQCDHWLLRFNPQQLKKHMPPRTGFWLIRILHNRFFGIGRRTCFWFWAFEIVLKNTNRGIHLILHFPRPTKLKRTNYKTKSTTKVWNFMKQKQNPSVK